MSNSNNKKCLLSICDISSTRYGSFEEFLVLLTEKLSANNFQHIVVFRDRPIASVEEALLNHGAKIEVFKPFTSSILNFLSLTLYLKLSSLILYISTFIPSIQLLIIYISSLILKLSILITWVAKNPTIRLKG